MQLVKNLVIVLSLGLMGTAAMAAPGGGLYVEPMLTYEKGDITTDYPAPFSNSTGTLEGAGFGARLGFHVADIVFLALDGRYSKPDLKDSNFSSKATSYNYGPVVGVQMPIVGLRVWGGYVLDGVADPEESNGADLKYERANGYRVGVGFHLIAVSINLEYQDVKYDSTTIERLGSFTSTQSQDSITMKNKAYTVSVSFPIEL